MTRPSLPRLQERNDDGRCRPTGAMRAKERLESWEAGERVIERIIAEHIEAGTPHAALTLRSYRCPHCGAWHIGHSGVYPPERFPNRWNARR